MLNPLGCAYQCPFVVAGIMSSWFNNPDIIYKSILDAGDDASFGPSKLTEIDQSFARGGGDVKALLWGIVQ